jgi:fructose-1,6-bisphosphatase/sedoheptulose 1,7-bisphosphatase-like protein
VLVAAVLAAPIVAALVGALARVASKDALAAGKLHGRREKQITVSKSVSTYAIRKIIEGRRLPGTVIVEGV